MGCSNLNQWLFVMGRFVKGHFFSYSIARDIGSDTTDPTMLRAIGNIKVAHSNHSSNPILRLCYVKWVRSLDTEIRWDRMVDYWGTGQLFKGGFPSSVGWIICGTIQTHSWNYALVANSNNMFKSIVPPLEYRYLQNGQNMFRFILIEYVLCAGAC